MPSYATSIILFQGNLIELREVDQFFSKSSYRSFKSLEGNHNTKKNIISLRLICNLFISFIYLLYRYWQLRIESTQPIFSIAFRANIPTTKYQTGNILGVSRIWKHWEVSNTSRFHADWQSSFTNIILNLLFSLWPKI